MRRKHEDELRSINRVPVEEIRTEPKDERRRGQRDPLDVFDEAIEIFHKYNEEQLRSEKRVAKFRDEFQQAGETIEAAKDGRDSEGNPIPPWAGYLAVGLGVAGVGYGIKKKGG